MPDNFEARFEYIPGGSCPFLFTWDGTGYKFESDNFTAGRIGGTVSTGYQQPNPNDAYVVANPPALNNGNLEFKLVEERYEVDYLDTYKLYAVDAPAGAKVYAEKAVAGKRTFPPLQSALHTTRNLHAPVSAVRTDTGADVLAAVSSEDATHVALNEDSEKTFTYKTLELDLGADAVSAPQVKVVMDAISEFPVTQEGIARRATFGLPQKLEVQDTDGTWRSIPASANPLPTPPEFTRPYIFDLTNAVQGGTGKVRFTFLFRTLIDYVGVDTTQDEWLTVTEVPQLAANLSYHGVDLETGAEDHGGIQLRRWRFGGQLLQRQLHPLRRRELAAWNHRRQVRDHGPGRRVEPYVPAAGRSGRGDIPAVRVLGLRLLQGPQDGPSCRGRAATVPGDVELPVSRAPRHIRPTPSTRPIAPSTTPASSLDR